MPISNSCYTVDLAGSNSWTDGVRCTRFVAINVATVWYLKRIEAFEASFSKAELVKKQQKEKYFQQVQLAAHLDAAPIALLGQVIRSSFAVQ